MGSFDDVDFKLAEADFFLEKLSDEKTDPLLEANFYFSAFVSAARSISFALQSHMVRHHGFAEWYARQQASLREDQLAKCFVDIRNLVQKRGLSPITGGSYRTNENGKRESRLFFDDVLGLGEEKGEPGDVILLSRRYMKRLVQLIFDCYADFGPLIDPDQYYTMKNLAGLSLTVDDIEESLGLPRGWTRLPGVADKERLELLRAHIPGSRIKAIFQKYL